MAPSLNSERRCTACESAHSVKNDGAAFVATLPLSRTRKEYSIRRSARASRLTLRVSPSGAVEVVIPFFTPESEAHELIGKNLLWLERTLRRLQGWQKAVPGTGGEVDYPVTFPLRFCGKVLPVAYEWRDVCWVGVRESEGRLAVAGAVLDANLVHAALRDYLIRLAGSLLEPLMRRTSQECSIPYGGLEFRIQRRRWGSCSGRKNISLNALLLFFPPEYARYVMVHELCHIREMNHSAAFWRLVGTFCRDYRYFRSSLNRESAKMIPNVLLRKI